MLREDPAEGHIGQRQQHAAAAALQQAPEQNNLLGAFRNSYGLLGVLYEATIRLRPIRTFAVSHRHVTIDKFASVVDALANGEVGFKFTDGKIAIGNNSLLPMPNRDSRQTGG